MKYKVQITEEITYTAEVQADSEQEAVDIFYKRHYDARKILRSSVSHEETVDQNVELLSDEPN